MSQVPEPILHWLQPQDPPDWFPDPGLALTQPNGLLAVGGQLSRPRLLAAYRQGLFPWFNEGELPQWWCPNPRCVIHTDAFHTSRSLRRRIQRLDYAISLDRCFSAVMAACAAPRSGVAGTWINPDMRSAYTDLNQAGYAHSLEVWAQGTLIGGIYGVALGRMFFGESMFSLQPNASKIALFWLSRQMQVWNMPLLDAQVSSAHLLSLGAVELPRQVFLQSVSELIAMAAPDWQWTLAVAPERQKHLPASR